MALKRMIAMRSFYRMKEVEGVTDTAVLDEVGLTEQQVTEMYRYLAIANYEDRFVIPTSNEELRNQDFHAMQGFEGFSFGNEGCSISEGASLFPDKRKKTVEVMKFVPKDRIIEMAEEEAS